MPAFDSLRDDYAFDWKRMVIPDGRRLDVDRIAHKLVAFKERYQAVEKATGVPWYVVAVLHERESDADFSTHLHNGDPLTRRTYHVPAGRPPPPAQPPFTWEESAEDALHYDGLASIGAWPIERIAYQCEGYNGWGYHSRGLPSPYLWSFSNIYRSGKYIGDGQFSASAVDRQCGVMPMLYAMAQIDRSIRFGGIPVVAKLPPAKPPPTPPPEPAPKVVPIRPPQSWWAFLLSVLKRKWRA
jgi:lysozyme family protein